MDGLLLVDKPAGMTSFDVVGRVRGVADMTQVGHMGTLDKAATGLLAILVGNATTLQRFVEEKVSSYRFEMEFGRRTDSLDRNGDVVEECDWHHVDAEAIRSVLPSFRGTVRQRPPKYSAVKIDGRRASDWARDDDASDRRPDPRDVEIRELELKEWDPPVAQLFVECVSGTYVRSIVRDLADELGSCAFTRSIRRLRTDAFEVDDAVELDELDRDLLEARLLPPRDMLASLPAYRVDREGATAVGYGQKLALDEDDVETLGVEPDDWFVVVDHECEVAAVAELRRMEDGFLLAPERVLKTSD